jgi:hypothetical protein
MPKRGREARKMLNDQAPSMMYEACFRLPISIIKSKPWRERKKER